VDAASVEISLYGSLLSSPNDRAPFWVFTQFLEFILEEIRDDEFASKNEIHGRDRYPREIGQTA
jgi:hypothetical protein